ncbi:TonB-dependent receptor domain-containing protein [Motiliproteus sediminis]|uniref:TonB-dependent receptor domain-containing protein n=1 Tax=Motiliproteus sediminis TaxID=1468178 RepID=UPI001AF0051D|nr:TonB-dependent receptor [Motiliproteus sediminis]
MKTRILLPLAALAAGSAVAADSADTLVVTATRIAQTTDQTLVPVSVLTRDQIERSPATTLPELLGQLPGVDFSVSGGHGKTASLFLRGTNSNHTLVLIDGVRVGSATLGSFPFEQIPLAQIERIELVRGPRSSLYGAEAIGGVIQIFTRKGGQGTHASARIGAGSHGTRDLQTGASWGDETTQASVNLGYFDTDGVDALDGVNPDDDGYSNSSLGLNLRQQLGRTTYADMSLLRAESENHYDSQAAPADDYSDNLQQTLGLRVTSELSDQLSLNGGINEHRDESENFDAFPSTIKTQRRGADLKGDYYLNDDHLLSLGVDFYRDEVSKTGGNYDRTERDNRALFAQWQGQYGKLNLLAGVRHDDNEAYGHHSTGNLNLGYRVAPDHRLLASVGTGFKAPTFNQLYWPGFGNPNLKPEESTSYELGYEGRAKQTTYALRAFHTQVDNLISSQPDNQQARIRGLEVELTGEFAGWQAAANATLLDAIDRDDGSRLKNRAERSLKVELGRRYSEIDWLLTLLAQGDRDTSSGTLAGYGLLNLKARYAIDAHWGLEAKVNNLTGKDYTTNADFLGRSYSGLDRSYLLSLVYQR